MSLIGVALIWGVNIPVMKYALGYIDSYAFNAIRLSFSALTLAVLFRLQSRPLIDRSSDAVPVFRQIAMICLFSLLAGFLYQLLFLLGIDGTSGGNTAIILSTIPMWTALLALLILNERLQVYAWIGLAIAFGGTIIVTLSKSSSGDDTSSLYGNLLVVAAAFVWALSVVWSRPILRKTSPVALAFVSVAATVPLHFLVASQGAGVYLEAMSKPKLAVAILYSGVFSTGLAYAMWNYGVQQLGAAHAAVFQNLVPLIALVAGWVFIGEVPFLLQLVGGGLIIAGLVIMRSRGNGATMKKKSQSPDSKGD
ncbi:MAG: DMT family transporter [Planctomycetota bacterium]